MKKFIFYVSFFALVATAVFNILGYFGQSVWFFDLFSHFKGQYLLILTTGTIVMIIVRRKFALLFLPFVVAILIETVPLYVGGNKNVDLTEKTSIACINLLSSNGRFEDVEKYIQQKNPDLIILQEFTMLWQIMLEPKLYDYRFRITIPRDDNFGIAVYSKIKVSEFEELKIGNAGIPSIHAELELGNTPISLIATHPLPPVGADYFEHRNVQLAALGRLVSRIENEVVVVGDLNTSSFSVHFKNLVSEANLVDSRKGFGLLTTWPTWFSLAQTTLDHCLVTEGISVKSREVGEDIGSDHLPIFVELGVE